MTVYFQHVGEGGGRRDLPNLVDGDVAIYQHNSFDRVRPSAVVFTSYRVTMSLKLVEDVD